MENNFSSQENSPRPENVFYTDNDIRFSFEDTDRAPTLHEFSSSFIQPIDTDRAKIIWGTTINIQNTTEKFKEFIRPKYNLSEIQFTHILDLDCLELEESLRLELTNYPQEILPLLNTALGEIYSEMTLEQAPEIRIRPYNLGNPLSIRDVDPRDIDKVVTVTGMAVRTSSVIPEVRRAMFYCVKCTRKIAVDSIKGIISEPSICECGERHTFEVRHNEGVYADSQVIKIQELPESAPDGATPSTITVVSKDDLVDSLIPGDRVCVTGILRAVPVKVSPNLNKLKSSFRIYLEMLSVRKLTNISNDNTDAMDLLEQVNNLKDQRNIYDILTASIASSVYGMDNVKKALLLQLFGGVSKNLRNSRLRGDINILLTGDPGISKSQLLGFVHRISERGMYTSGRGSSAVGLTASVTKDPDTGQYVLESGALVLSDRGICCIDEFDKMNETTRSVLHEVMEQQTVSVAKAGIITTLNARCSVLASCNPVESKYNTKKSILDNINLPPTLLSRFDIVCVLIDRADQKQDRRVGEHILDMYMGVTDELKCVSPEVLRLYIKEAKRISPVLTAQSIDAITEAYVELRQLDNGKSVTATTRQLESLVRLSEAHARMRFSRHVEGCDVKEAIRLIKESLLLYALDPRTGKIDIDMIITGRSATEGRMIDEAREKIERAVKHKVNYSELISMIGVEERIFNEALNELDREGVIIYERISGTIERIK